MNQFSSAGAMPLTSTNVMQLNVKQLNVKQLNVKQLNVKYLNVMSVMQQDGVSVMQQDGVMTHDGTRPMGFLPLMCVSFDSELACAGSWAISNR